MSQDNKFISHVGVLGMKWGHRMAVAGKAHDAKTMARDKGRQAAVSSAVKNFKEAGKAHDAKTTARDKGRQAAVSSAIKKFNEAGKAHDAKTMARDKGRQAAVSSAVKNFKEAGKAHDAKTNKKRTPEEQKARNQKRLNIGKSVVAGLVASNISAMVMLKGGGSLSAIKIAAPIIAVVGGMKYYDTISKPSGTSKPISSSKTTGETWKIKNYGTLTLTGKESKEDLIQIRKNIYGK